MLWLHRVGHRHRLWRRAVQTSMFWNVVVKADMVKNYQEITWKSLFFLWLDGIRDYRGTSGKNAASMALLTHAALMDIEFA